MFPGSKISRAAALLTLILSAVASSALAQSNWVARTIVTDAEGIIYNADVMVSPAGEVSVGYAISLGGLVGGPITLAKLNDQLLFEYHTFDLPGTAPSFAVDPYGGVYYASNNLQNSGPTTFGQDLGPWGGLQDSEILDSDGLLYPSLAVDQYGIPALAGNASNTGTMSYAHFDVPSGQWQTQIVGPMGWYGHSLCFDSDNKAALAYVQYTPGQSAWDPAPLIIARDGSMGWDNSTLAIDAIPRALASIAAGLNGEVGFAYYTDQGLMFGTNSNSGDTLELINPNDGSLRSHSLAYDPDGNPAIVSGLYEDPQLHLFRRDSQGQWSEELLPATDGYPVGNLTFDSAGNPYVAALDYPSPPNITLLSPVLPPHPGDVDGNGYVSGLDLTTVINNWGKTGQTREQGDLDGDGTVSGPDYTEVVTYWGTGTPPPEPTSAIPEPATLALLLISSLTLFRKKLR